MSRESEKKVIQHGGSKKDEVSRSSRLWARLWAQSIWDMSSSPCRASRWQGRSKRRVACSGNLWHCGTRLHRLLWVFPRSGLNMNIIYKKYKAARVMAGIVI